MTSGNASAASQPDRKGAGPLLQRDYWAVLTGLRLTPSELMAHVKAHFCELPPRSLVQFVAPQGLAIGATLEIDITPGQHIQVRVIHDDAQSVTLATLAGHPEVGRITFGAYRNGRGEIVLHIRSRARSASVQTLAGFLAIGEAMQTNTWTDFINNTATTVGAAIAGPIHADTTEMDARDDDDDRRGTPTFLATGD